jgi:hypothetical protein
LRTQESAFWVDLWIHRFERDGKRSPHRLTGGRRTRILAFRAQRLESHRQEGCPGPFSAEGVSPLTSRSSVHRVPRCTAPEATPPLRVCLGSSHKAFRWKLWHVPRSQS